MVFARLQIEVHGRSTTCTLQKKLEPIAPVLGSEWLRFSLRPAQKTARERERERWGLYLCGRREQAAKAAARQMTERLWCWFCHLSVQADEDLLMVLDDLLVPNSAILCTVPCLIGRRRGFVLFKAMCRWTALLMGRMCSMNLRRRYGPYSRTCDC